MNSRIIVRTSALLALLVLVLVAPRAHAGYDETFTYDASSLKVTNLIGRDRRRRPRRRRLHRRSPGPGRRRRTGSPRIRVERRQPRRAHDRLSDRGRAPLRLPGTRTQLAHDLQPGPRQQRPLGILRPGQDRGPGKWQRHGSLGRRDDQGPEGQGTDRVQRCGRARGRRHRGRPGVQPSQWRRVRARHHR